MQPPSFTDAHHDRRQRRPEQAVAGYPDIPVYERHNALRAAGSARGAVMGRVLRMDTTGLWVVHLGGELAEMGGRCYWNTRGDLEEAAKRAGIALSDLIFHTGREAQASLTPPSATS
ncbi:MAG TPA: hypothetical protein VD978_08765 [Azospirillum sp.]|nr:hypothetical protein [Azospirillum sp.]